MAVLQTENTNGTASRGRKEWHEHTPDHAALFHAPAPAVVDRLLRIVCLKHLSIWRVCRRGQVILRSKAGREVRWGMPDQTASSCFTDAALTPVPIPDMVRVVLCCDQVLKVARGACLCLFCWAGGRTHNRNALAEMHRVVGGPRRASVLFPAQFRFV